MLPEYRFDPKRRWRCDYWIFTRKHGQIAVEIEGLNGRHQSMKGFLADMKKYNAISALRVLLFRFTNREIADGSALLFLESTFP